MSNPRNTDEPTEPTTYFQIQRNRAANPGETKPPTDISELPPLPATSPWSGDPVGKEPSIDRSEDSDVVGVPIDQT